MAGGSVGVGQSFVPFGAGAVLIFFPALFPFVAGTISSVKGVHTLTYVTVPLAGMIAFLWALFPSKKPSKLES